MTDIKGWRRIMSGGNYLPQIDGLRFIAIFLVVFYHVIRNYTTNTSNLSMDQVDFILKQLDLGRKGVELFFVISGFILAVPFNKAFRTNSKIDLKKYFLRRLTRLEPPYILIMTIMMIVYIFLKHVPVNVVIPHYFASLLYSHFLFYPNTLPLINGVAWSLEIEIQFYIITPILANIFRIKAPYRKLLIFISILFFAILNEGYSFSYQTIINYLHYFLIGYLLSDFFLDKKNQGNYSIPSVAVILLLILVVIPFDIFFSKYISEIIYITCIFLSYYFVIINNKAKFFFQNSFITIVGGMCYSIYLIHLPIIGIINITFRHLGLFADSYFYLAFYFTVNFILILIISALYYKYIERPCMNPNWYKKFIPKKR